MRKIIINRCFGGYYWSNEAILDYIKRKDIEYRIKPNNNIVVKGKYLDNTLYDEDEWYSFYGGMINREDPVAIQLLEEKGSKYCSGRFSELEIEEYDEEDWIPSIDEYDGLESLELTARLTEARIRDCNSIDEVIKLLNRLKLIKE